MTFSVRLGDEVKYVTCVVLPIASAVTLLDQRTNADLVTHPN